MIEPARWDWDDVAGPARLIQELRDHGVTLFHLADAAEASRAPQELVNRLLAGVAGSVAIARLLIKVDHRLARRTYPKTSVEAQLHVDPPNFGHLTPSLQMMVCRRPADRGGDNLVLDAWDVLRDIAVDDPGLFGRLFDTPRRINLAGYVVWGPTIALRRGHLACHHGAFPPRDPVGEQFRARLVRRRPIEFRAQAGDIYINDNHRMLHGRRAFSDPLREFERINIWLAEPMPAPAPFVERATAAAAALAHALAGEPAWIQEAFGVLPCDDPALAPMSIAPRPPDAESDRELARVLAALGGGARA